MSTGLAVLPPPPLPCRPCVIVPPPPPPLQFLIQILDEGRAQLCDQLRVHGAPLFTRHLLSWHMHMVRREMDAEAADASVAGGREKASTDHAVDLPDAVLETYSGASPCTVKPERMANSLMLAVKLLLRPGLLCGAGGWLLLPAVKGLLQQLQAQAQVGGCVWRGAGGVRAGGRGAGGGGACVLHASVVTASQQGR